MDMFVLTEEPVGNFWFELRIYIIPLLVNRNDSGFMMA